MERTLLLIKPDGVERKLCGEIISRFERKGWNLVAMKLMVVPVAMAEEHYAEHKGKPFFPELIEYITGGPIVAMVWEGHEIIKSARNLMGKTNSVEAAPGSIRGDFGNSFTQNIVHGSDSPASAEREINLFFSKDEMVG